MWFCDDRNSPIMDNFAHIIIYTFVYVDCGKYILREDSVT